MLSYSPFRELEIAVNTSTADSGSHPKNKRRHQLAGSSVQVPTETNYAVLQQGPPASATQRRPVPGPLIVLWMLVGLSGFVGVASFSGSSPNPLLGASFLAFCGLSLLFALAVQALY